MKYIYKNYQYNPEETFVIKNIEYDSYFNDRTIPEINSGKVIDFIKYEDKIVYFVLDNDILSMSNGIETIGFLIFDGNTIKDIHIIKSYQHQGFVSLMMIVLSNHLKQDLYVDSRFSFVIDDIKDYPLVSQIVDGNKIKHREAVSYLKFVKSNDFRYKNPDRRYQYLIGPLSFKVELYDKGIFNP